MYHRVNDGLAPNDLVTPVGSFRQQMLFLKQNYTITSMEELLGDDQTPQTIGDGRKKPKILITFDDGYRDNYRNAYPILKELWLPATIFLITGMIGTDKKRPRYQGMPDPDMLNWDEVKEMSKNGSTFGAHTVSHPHLSQLSYEEQRKEIWGSIRTLVPPGPEVSVPQQIFCYPYGDYNNDTLSILKELGVKLALTVRPGINNGKVDPLELRRTEINGIDTLFDFKKKLAGAFDGLHEWLQKKKRP